MARARILPDGVTAPVDNGRSIQERIKRTSSSIRMPRLSSKRFICCSILRPSPSRFCSNSRIWRSILRSMRVFLTSRRRSCRPIFRSNDCRAGNVMAPTRQRCCGYLRHLHHKNHRARSSSAGAAAEPIQELLDLAEESGGFRLRLARRQAFKFSQQVPLLFGELLGSYDHHLDIHVAALARTEHWHAFAGEAEAAAGLRALRHFHFGLGAVDRRHFEFAAERSGHHGNRNAAVQVGAFALEERMRADRQEYVKIAGRPAAHAGFAFAGEPDAGAVLDPRRNIHRQRAFAGHPPGAGAGCAWRIDRLAAAVTIRAGAFEREKALGVTHPAVATAHRTGLRLGAGLGTGAGTGFAGHRGWNADLRCLAVEGFLERNLHVVTQIGAALAAARAPAPGRHAENAFKQIGKGGAEIGAESSGAATHPMLEGGMAKAVVSSALVRILQNFIGLVDLLEPNFGRLVAGIAIRMELHRTLAKGGLDLAIAGRAVDR